MPEFSIGFRKNRFESAMSRLHRNWNGQISTTNSIQNVIAIITSLLPSRSCIFSLVKNNEQPTNQNQRDDDEDNSLFPLQIFLRLLNFPAKFHLLHQHKTQNHVTHFHLPTFLLKSQIPHFFFFFLNPLLQKLCRYFSTPYRNSIPETRRRSRF